MTRPERTEVRRLAPILSLVLAVGCNDWEFNSRTDEMSGAVRQSVSRESPDKVRFPGSLVSKAGDYHPWVSVSVSGSSPSLRVGTGEPPACRYVGSTCTQRVRFKFDDKAPIDVFSVHRATNDEYLTVDEAVPVVKAFKAHAMLRIEYQLSRGEKVVAKFPLAGFASEFAELCASRKDHCDPKLAPDLHAILNE